MQPFEYKLITINTAIKNGDTIRGFKEKNYKIYKIGSYISELDKFEIFPDGINYRKIGTIFVYSKQDMIDNRFEILIL